MSAAGQSRGGDRRGVALTRPRGGGGRRRVAARRLCGRRRVARSLFGRRATRLGRGRLRAALGPRGDFGRLQVDGRRLRGVVRLSAMQVVSANRPSPQPQEITQLARRRQVNRGDRAGSISAASSGRGATATRRRRRPQRLGDLRRQAIMPHG